MATPPQSLTPSPPHHLPPELRISETNIKNYCESISNNCNKSLIKKADQLYKYKTYLEQLHLEIKQFISGKPQCEQTQELVNILQNLGNQLNKKYVSNSEFDNQQKRSMHLNFETFMRSK
jgi:hypothetical protein